MTGGGGDMTGGGGDTTDGGGDTLVNHQHQDLINTWLSRLRQER
jgi:hypothetical protein